MYQDLMADFKISWLIEGNLPSTFLLKIRKLCIVVLRTFHKFVCLDFLWIPILELRRVSHWDLLKSISSVYVHKIAFHLIVIVCLLLIFFMFICQSLKKIQLYASPSFYMYKESCYATIDVSSCFFMIAANMMF